jgi:hypothetical protein
MRRRLMPAHVLEKAAAIKQSSALVIRSRILLSVLVNYRRDLRERI